MKTLLKYATFTPNWQYWKYLLRGEGSRMGLFRNLSGVVPGRWGFYILGFEVGPRDPGNSVGVWLKENGYWKW